jgi:hypothetical protein
MRWIAAVYASLRALALVAFAGSAAQAQAPADADDRAWINARDADTAQAYQSYLQQFPVGRHVEEAYRSLVEEQLEMEFGGSDAAVRGLSVY